METVRLRFCVYVIYINNICHCRLTRHFFLTRHCLSQIPVPRDAVGIVIGKGGDMIKKIQGQFSVKIQFQNDGGGPQRMCDISGSMNDVMAAKQHVQELIADNQVGGVPT